MNNFSGEEIVVFEIVKIPRNLQHTWKSKRYLCYEFILMRKIMVLETCSCKQIENKNTLKKRWKNSLKLTEIKREYKIAVVIQHMLYIHTSIPPPHSFLSPYINSFFRRNKKETHFLRFQLLHYILRTTEKEIKI